MLARTIRNPKNVQTFERSPEKCLNSTDYCYNSRFSKEKRDRLVVANNFYMSCGRVFNPKLEGRPVVVLWELKNVRRNKDPILKEEWNRSEQIPQVDDRARDYANLADPGNGITHGKDEDWVVAEVQQFNSPNTDMTTVVCVGSYQPIEAQWQELRRGAPIFAESLAGVTR